MSKLRWILFDCMETIIDLKEIPPSQAPWFFRGSGYEHYWESEDDFCNEYEEAKKTLSYLHNNHKEYNLFNRLELLVSKKLCNCDRSTIDSVARCLLSNYWNNYKALSYVNDDVQDILEHLEGRYSLGIISNFMVQDGVEELLTYNGIDKYFNFVITSIKEGFRKPHLNIYNSALIKCNCSVDEILYIGDDLECDYIGARNAGIKSILLDRANKNKQIRERIVKFQDLKDELLNGETL